MFTLKLATQRRMRRGENSVATPCPALPHCKFQKSQVPDPDSGAGHDSEMVVPEVWGKVGGEVALVVLKSK